MFEGLENINLFPTTGMDILVNLSVALACGLFISCIYRLTYRGPGYSVSFINSLVLLAMITSIVIMVIGNNLARAFGLVGAMSIIRFRTAIKDTQDIVYVFFCLAIGLSAGVGYYKIAVMGSLFIGGILFLMARFGWSASKHKEYLLQFYFTPNGNESPLYMPILKRHCRHHKVINAKSVDSEDTLELSYYIKLKDDDNSNRLLRDLRNSPGVGHLNLFFDEQQI